MRFALYLLLVNLFITGISRAQTPVRSRTNVGTAIVSGYVRETGSQEALISVNVYLPGASTGTATNTYGFYPLMLPRQDSLRSAYSFVGYETVTRSIDLRTGVTLNVSFTPGRCRKWT